LDKTISDYDFDARFSEVMRYPPLRWQRRLFHKFFMPGHLPAALDLPTGLGKTAVMAIWYLALRAGAPLPRRLVYVVDRRAVVDQATTVAEDIKRHDEKLAVSTLRGQHVDNREWLNDPAAPAIIVGTVDMIGSRLLFSGYGVSRKMRPYHAGFLGTDALVVLDEAHLVPPFAHLLRAIEKDVAFQPANAADRSLLPCFTFLPLSATQRDVGADEHERAPFRLEDEDWTDGVAKKRLEASKRLRLKPLAEDDDADRQLAEAAWALAKKDGRAFHVAIFCDRRDKKDEGDGPSAQGVAEAIRDLAKGDKKTGRAMTEIHSPELLVGARRVHEREAVAERLRALGFIGEKKPLEKPAFLVATSAGEVGVDIDADHMVCDLVAWERMVQRLGRVNRRGEAGEATIVAFAQADPKPKGAAKKALEKRATDRGDKDRRAIEAFEAECMRVRAYRRPFGEALHAGSDRAFDVSPGALHALADCARKDEALSSLIAAATTPEPLRPAVNRALLDAWSMTSLETHAGRPEVAPWLRGWVEEKPLTTIVWRAHLPLRIDDHGRTILPRKPEIDDFFEAAPPHESEKLEMETYRVASWLEQRGNVVLKGSRQAPQQSAADEDADPELSQMGDVDAEGAETGQRVSQARKLRPDDVAALILSSSGIYEGSCTVGELPMDRKGKDKDQFQSQFIGKVLVIDARFGGLKDGMLNAASEASVETADTSREWSAHAQFRVRKAKPTSDGEVQEDGWRFEDDFVLRRDDEGASLEWLIVEHFRDAAQKEDARSISKPEELATHQDRVRHEMSHIAEGTGLSSVAANALAVGASLHDEGKRAPRWQRAFRAPREKDEQGGNKIFAKTLGPIDQAILSGYRHEFGSLALIEKNPAFEALPEDWRELVLHLVAAHHGQARPVIEMRGCEDAPPSMLEERASSVALRFARVQKRWGPWGLAWWEALLRAADQQASRANEQGQRHPATENSR
jgi:CRISPR-associated endonuclease/helicase Cas3